MQPRSGGLQPGHPRSVSTLPVTTDLRNPLRLHLPLPHAENEGDSASKASLKGSQGGSRGIIPKTANTEGSNVKKKKNKLNLLSWSFQKFLPRRSNCGWAAPVRIDSLEWAATHAKYLCAAPLHLCGLLLMSPFREKRFLLPKFCTPIPQAGSLGRDHFAFSASLLSLPSLGLWSCPPVNGFLWLITKDPAAFRRAEPSVRSENSIPPQAEVAQPHRDHPPSRRLWPLGAPAQTPQRAWALPASAPQPLSASSSAAIFPQEHWEDAGVCSAPAPSLFLSFPALGSCCLEPGEVPRRKLGARAQVSAAARERS